VEVLEVQVSTLAEVNGYLLLFFVIRVYLLYAPEIKYLKLNT